MPEFKASVHVSGFIEVTVNANSKEEAETRIRSMNLSPYGREVESLVFNEFETEPELTEESFVEEL